jgi:hypothetical protein
MSRNSAFIRPAIRRGRRERDVLALTLPPITALLDA